MTELKSIISGYASFDYEITITKRVIWLNQEFCISNNNQDAYQ